MMSELARSIPRLSAAAMPRIDGVGHDPDARIALLQGFECRVLTGSIVDDDKFEITKLLLQDAIDRGIEKAEVGVDGHDDRRPWTG